MHRATLITRKNPMMIRPTCALTLVFIASLAGCRAPDSLPSWLSSTDRATIYEAVYVHQHAIRVYEQGNYRDAIAVAEKALDLLEGTLGPSHPCVAVPVHSLAVFQHTQGAYAKAEPLYARVIGIQEEVLGATHVDLARPLDELAALYMQWGEYRKAEPLYARALAIRERALESSHPDVMESLNNLALSLDKQGMYARAEPLYARALALAEKVLGPKHPNVARGLNGLGMMYWTQGAYARAEPLLTRALTIREGLLVQANRFGPAHVDKFFNIIQVPRSNWSKSKSGAASLGLSLYAGLIEEVNSGTIASLSNVDELYSTTGVYAKAEPLMSRTADIFETVLETVHSGVAQSLDNLAQIYVATGQHKRAEPLLVRTLDSREKARGATHPDVANSLNNLAQLYQTQGAYAKAEPLLLRALEIREKALGATHPDVARSLNNLALLYRMRGAYAKAEPLLVRAANIFEKALGGTHPDVARSLNNLALIYHDQGTYSKAEPLYLRAVDIMSTLPGGAHPDAVRYLNNLAVLFHASGAPEKAEPLMARAAEIRESQLRLELARLSASRKRDLMMLLQRETDSLVSLHADSTPASDQAFELALTTVLRRKGLVLDSLVDNQATLRAHLTPDIRDKLGQLAVASRELSALLHAPVEPRTAGARASVIGRLRTRIDVLESELNAASAALRAKSQTVTPAMIQTAIPPGAALIELVRYRRFDPRRDRQRWQEARYVAYILQRQGPPLWLALGAAAPIDAGVDAVLAEMHRNPSADATKGALQYLDTLVLAPLRGSLTNVKHIIVAPDSKLNLVPFEALIDPQGRYELEHRLVSYVTSGRDLLQLAARQAPRSPATIVAAPNYGPGKPFAHLDGASFEAMEVSAHFPGARILTGDRATRAALAAVVGPAVLHIATHGFFARDAVVNPMSTPATSLSRSPPLTSLDPLERDMFVEGVLGPSSLPASGDPAEALDRAGLALANANTNPEGIVTAREIMSYDWWGTRLVVLSACATGVGAVPSGEGVYGLRRALVLAGVESQVVSLWNVSDSSARALMRGFYGELARGTGRAEALRRAKLSMLQQPKLAHPYYWAAFIPAGNWTPLDKSTMPQQLRVR
jgi:CHAT domain-containing protein/tetratricopeptide (TPR) repeat protein